ncbi:AAA domain-containing protein [Pectobacterium aroidearum]|nr:AAA domain-containing protein [Pectobacterium aroidearum]UUE46554.1 AAA domain-containing protein [Pectobacterium aroidearum]UUE50752.1 AAA domain-containing protein [Pectobacterium aroidearum]UUE54980.1 AAA domain-containing protein [Pectobacterium aroidearum]UUE63388.1 AAA domain-containing protein [Pectobacterium aroidearum]UUE67613.1 AAA domain-containing protein [Pectobacterium aroidearum]
MMAETSLSNDILRAWQRIEFFQPYTLEERKNSLQISFKELSQNKDTQLPWLSADLCKQHEIPPKASYCIHIGLFDKGIANTVSQKVFGPDTELNTEEQEQRLDQEGTTCFAKLQLDPEGVPVLDKLSISSLPWALGHLEKERFQLINSESFATGCQQLASTLRNFSATLKPVRENGPGVLRADDIFTLLTAHLVAWADFEPKWEYVLQIDWFEKKGNISEALQEEEDETEEDVSENDKSLVLPILNSFFFEDIELVISSIKRNDECKALRTYLADNAPRNADLYSQNGLASIIDKLQPANMPHGRWPSPPEHAMSLMQQFAINTAIEELVDGGLLSVNGPPGTGKTTLLRDLIAHNVVERAKKLSRFKNVDDTLNSDGFIVHALTGFEMVVASSNNSAVENISKELPQKKSLAEEFRSLSYLAPTANQIAAKYRPKSEHKKIKEGPRKGNFHHLFQPLKDEAQCWGIISAALGKKDNRTKFTQRLFFDEHFERGTQSEISRPNNEDFLSLWRWKHYHASISFAEAKKQFINCVKQTEALQQQLITYAILLSKQPDDTLDTLSLKLTEITNCHEERLRELALNETQQYATDTQIQFLEQQQKDFESNKPSWLTRLINRKRFIDYQNSQHAIKLDLLKQREIQAGCVQKVAEQLKWCTDIEKTKRGIEQDIANIIQQQRNDQETLLSLKAQFPDIVLPAHTQSIDDATLQRTAFWQNEQINRQRSALFVASMELHQSWLYEALGIKRFRNRIYNIKDFLASPHTETTPILWWQTLFMIVPVISTTFASIGRMFHGVKNEELGWLMIDEAGQAPPQQAVGAIWRAKRVLVVGDPLQIEPVFTTPQPLVERLCLDVLQEHAKDWNPGMLSVQQVADRVNSWGCELHVMNRSIWIGIPLWVHRRCIEPMFSLSNKMAYDNRMIHGVDTDKIVSQSINNVIHNHWLASTGGQGEKQYRDSHGNDFLILLDRLLAENVQLNSIYVITPFKAVKTGILQLVEQRSIKVWRQHTPLIKQQEINDWKSKCIGTVHTFQGKENDIVIFVLGCDENSDGGAKWAASKPNLLNVALTRAKKNIFVIGNPNVWHGLPWFQDLANKLPTEY